MEVSREKFVEWGSEEGEGSGSMMLYYFIGRCAYLCGEEGALDSIWKDNTRFTFYQELNLLRLHVCLYG